jgi:hypothetical protein
MWWCVCLLFFVLPIFAGGPLNVDPESGNPFVWDTTNPVPYNPDLGGLGILPFGWDNATATAMTEDAFQRWQNVSTATITYQNAGQLSIDVDGSNFGPFFFPEEADGLNPIVFDEDGTIFATLFGPGSGIIGFATPEVFDLVTFKNVEGLAFLNGEFLDGDPDNVEFDDAQQMFGTLVHEFGHYSGLAHTVVNGQAFILGEDTGFGVPTPDQVEIMYPFALDGQGDTPLADDIASLSTLYPVPTFFTDSGTISGRVFFEDGVSPANGVNVIARNPNDPFLDAISAITGDFISGDPFGNPAFQGLYTIEGLTGGNEYRVEIDQIVAGGFSTPPIAIPGPEEFFNGANESADPANDDPGEFTPVAAVAGSPVTDIDVIINSGVSNEPFPITDALILDPLGTQTTTAVIQEASHRKGINLSVADAQAAIEARLQSTTALQAALDALGVTNQTSRFLPSNLSDFAYLFVVLGQFPANFAISEGSPIATTIENYIAGGGNVYMEGGDVWFFDPQVGGHDFAPTFGIVALEDGATGGEFNNVLGANIADGQDFAYNVGTDNFPDHIDPMLGSSFRIHENDSPAFTAGVARPFGLSTNGPGRTIGTSFEFGQLIDAVTPGTKVELMSNYIDFFNNGFTFGVGPQIRVRPQTLDFGPGLVGRLTPTQTALVLSGGTEDATITDIFVDSSFTLVSAPVLPAVIPSGETVIIEVGFSPQFEGPMVGTLTIESDDANDPTLEVTLLGEGIFLNRAEVGICYASTGRADGGRMLTIDTVTGAGTLIGSTGLAAVPALAINSSGEIFGVDELTGDLYAIDAASGVAVSLGSTGLFALQGIAFDSSDVLYAVNFNLDDGSASLYTIDVATVTATLVGTTGDYMAGLAFDPIDGTLWGSGSGTASAVPDGIYTIDPTNGATTLVGETGLGGSTPDLHFDSGGNLYGVKGGGQSPNQLIVIDKTSGAGTVVGPVGFFSVSGLASFVGEIPCPNIQTSPRSLSFDVVINESATDVLRIINAGAQNCDTALDWTLSEQEIALSFLDGTRLPVLARKRPQPDYAIYEQKLGRKLGPDELPSSSLANGNVLDRSPLSTYQATQDCAWLSANPTNGTIPAGGSQDVEIVVDAAGLAPGTYDCTLQITSNDSVKSVVSIPVTLNVEGPSFCVNRSFETGDFFGWEATDITSPFFPLTVDGASIDVGFDFFVSDPTNGSFAALHGFDGSGPGMIRIAQDVVIPNGATTIEFDYRGGWNMTFGATQDRTFEVSILPEGGGDPLRTDLILTATAGSIIPDTGPLVGAIDVSAFSGSAVRLSFDWNIPEAFTGPGFFQLDNIVCPDITIDVQASVLCPPSPPQGCPITAEIKVDMSGAFEPNNLLGSFSGLLSWDPTQLEYVGDSGLLSNFTGVVNVDQEAGQITFNGANPAGTDSVVDILNVEFSVLASLGSTGVIDLGFSAMAAAGSFTDLLPTLGINDCTFEVGEPELLGDLNGDGAVNSTDALICLSFDIGVPIPPEFEERIDAGFGDVNGDQVSRYLFP